MITPNSSSGVGVVKNNFVFAVGGGRILESVRSVKVLDLSSDLPCWKQTTDMFFKRRNPGIGVINNFLYAIGGMNSAASLNSVEVFDCNTHKWHILSSMSIQRSCIGVGVLNNLLYVVGGCQGSTSSHHALKSVECYYPGLDKWSPIADMCVPRDGAGVGVLDGVLYAVGGRNGSGTYLRRSVETYIPSTGVWTIVAPMNKARFYTGVVALDGLLYVIGGHDGKSILDSAEFYNPNTNTWTMITASLNIGWSLIGVVIIDKPPYF